MYRYAGILITSILLVLAGPAHGQTFKHEGLARDAQRYEVWLNKNWPATSQSVRRSKALGLRLLNDASPRAASGAFAQAVVNDKTDAEAWISLARALNAIPRTQLRGAERYNIPTNASAAAYLGYIRGRSAQLRSEALAVLARVLQRRSYWRAALDAYKVSLSLRENAAVRAAYDTLHASKGFRIMTYKVENETATPRLCIEFSELLKKGETDFAKFVAVNGKDPQGVSPEGNQLCIDGFAHGQRYEVAVRAGLPADIDDQLAKSSELAVYVRDRSPTVRFSGRSYVLPSRGQAGIPIVSINTSEIAVKVYRIGDRNLVSAVLGGNFTKQMSQWDVRQLRDKRGQKVYDGRLTVRRRLNEEVTTAIPIGDAVPKLQPGVYTIVANAADDPKRGDRLPATQWFIVSDLGLTALSGSNGIHVFVRSLATTQALAGVKLRLLARNNEVLANVISDGKGYARFEAGLGNGEGGLAPALLVGENANGDYAFLNMAAAAFDLTDRGVKGRATPGPVDGFIYSERGVYRPGEDVNLTALIRDSGGRASAVPVTMIVARPDGVEHRRIALRDQGAGGRTASFTLSGAAMTGTWRIRVHTDPKAAAIATAAFLVEDFVPERLGLQLEALSKELVPGSTGKIRVNGKFLYGPPAANLALEGEIVVGASNRDVAGFPGFKFGQQQERIDTERGAIEGAGSTNAKGEAVVTVALPQVPRTARPLDAAVTIRMREPGGRAIERRVTLPVAAVVPRIGIKPLFKGAALEEGGAARFEILSIDQTNQRTALKDIAWELVRLERRWQWYKRDGAWTYDAVTIPRMVASGTIDTDPAAATTIAAAVGWGKYRLDVRARDDRGPSSSFLFTAGWYASEEADSPEVLAVALDKESYRPGETAKLKISSRSGGRVQINVLNNGLLATHETDIEAGGGEVAVKVDTGWGAGAYLVATLYRAMDGAAKRMPERALGVAWLAIDQAPRTLRVALDLPEKVRSGRDLAVPIAVTGLAADETAYVTVAAVDVGVLNLTRFKAPAPETWFYAQRRLGTEYRDFYGRLIDGMRAERGTLRSGGGGPGGAGLQGNPPLEATLSLFSGIIKADASGQARVTFELPDFNGTVKVMTVAWSATKLGHATKDVIVRDPVTITATAPRFLTLGDKARLHLDLHNVEGPDAPYTIKVTQTYQGDAAGPAAGPTQVHSSQPTLGANQHHRITFDLAPEAIGQVAYDVRVTGPGGIDVSRDLLLDVKAPARDVRRVTVSTLRPNGGSIAVSDDLLQDMIPGQARISLSVGPLASFDVPGLLNQLDRYPYGCAEQTTSRALPLLYANALAVQSAQRPDGEVRKRVEKAIVHLYSMQDSAGSFGVWGPNNGDIWLTAYVTDFLSRARQARYDVDMRKFNNALDRLQNFVGYVSDFKTGGEDRAYALYVLARNGRAPIGELRYYADTRLHRFATPLAKAQIGAALAMMGDKARAERAFQAAIDDLGEMTGTRSRQDYGSGLRDGAAVLTLVSEAQILPARLPKQIPELIDVLGKAFAARSYTSTQEQAWLLLAANALVDKASNMQLRIAGKPHSGPLRRTVTAAEVRHGPLTIENAGAEQVASVLTVRGSARTPEPAAANGIEVERRYYRLAGEPVEIGNGDGATSAITQSQRLVVVLRIKTDQPGGRMLLIDRLAAGLEIENPRLVGSGDVAALPWLKREVHPTHTEFRDDRFVAAFDFFAAGNKKTEATVAYVVRAVSPGDFVHPAALVEDMYRPYRFARTGAGRLLITERK